MSKAVLISIQPKWCELIASGRETIVVRKTKPKIPTPFKCYIYCTKPKSKNDLGICLEDGKVGLVYQCNYDAAERYDMQILSGKVIGEFVCDEIYDIGYAPYNHGGFISNINGFLSNTDDLYKKSCLDLEKMFNYLSHGYGYGWHISDLKIYDKPKELSEFRKPIDCHRGNEKHQCIGCWDCEIKRPPQSWCYVERLVDEQ